MYTSRCSRRAPALALLLLAAATGDEALRESHAFASLAAAALGDDVGVALGRDAATGLRGLFAARAAAPGDLLLRVPLARCLVETRALPASLRRAPASMTWDVRLALQLHDGSEHDGFWAAYGGLLPRGDDLAQPLVLRPRDLDRLGDAPAAAAAREQRRRLRELFPDLPPDVLPADDGDASFPGTLLVAWANVRSRAFAAGTAAVAYEGEAGTEESDRFAFVPFLDMGNHEASRPTAAFAVVGDAFELRALAPLAAGDGVTYSYAEPRDVRAHFALYGYVPGSACATRSCHVAAYRALARAREL